MGKEKKQFLIFIIVSFGIPFFMGIPLAICHSKGYDVTLFAQAQMYYPAAGVILARLITNKDDALLPKKFFIAYLILTAVLMFASLLTLTGGSNGMRNGINILALIGNVAVGLIYLMEGKEKLMA